MILLLEIGMLIAGIVALCSGKLKLSREWSVEGTAARLAGFFLLLPLPLALVMGFMIGFNAAIEGREFDPEQLGPGLILAELGIVAVCGILAVVIVLAAGSGEAKRARRRADADWDEDSDRVATPPLRTAVQRPLPARSTEAKVAPKPVRLPCPNCSTSLSVPESLAGKKVRCPRCNEVFPVPAVTTSPEEDIPMVELVEQGGRG